MSYNKPNRLYREFVQQYVVTLLWCSTDDEGEPLDKNFSSSDIPLDVAKRIVADCRKFWTEANDDIFFNPSQAGHDFALTRNHHGAGFWDGEWEEEVGEKLTKLSHSFGEFDLFFECGWILRIREE
jgi:hypothetical protein